MRTPEHIVIDARIRRSTTGRYADRLLEHLQKLDTFHRYTILVQPNDPWQPTAPNFSALPCPYPQFSLNPLHQIGFSRQLYALKPNLVHFTMTQQPLPYFGNIVTTTHDTTMYSFVRRGSTPVPLYKLKMGLYRFLVWWSHRKSRFIIVPTRTVAKEFSDRQPFTRKKLVVTYEASEPPLRVKGVRPSMVDEDFILYVGTAFPHKNLRRLVEALEILHRTHPSLKLVMTGKRDEKHMVELREWFAGRSCAQNIILPGFVSDAELKWLYEHCEAYVFPSLSEGFGLPPLEAMAHGAPVASSRASVMPEVYGDAAHYFDATDPTDIASRIAEIIDNPKLAAKLRTAGTRQLQKYSWRTMAAQTLTVYEDALAPPSHTKEPEFDQS